MQGKIFQLNLAPDGGVPKLPVNRAVLTMNGFVGDVQKNTKYHGGTERALCLYTREQIEVLQREGHPIFPGSVGENVTVEGVEWDRIVPGVRLELGNEVIIEVSRYTVPCRTIAHSFVDGKFRRISQDLHPGESRVYARVIRGGEVCVGQSVQLIG
ncbi:MAG: MOSC domain-containing protein [Pyrinomonadaceae bacterium]